MMLNEHINQADASQTRCHLLFMANLCGGVVVPYFWEEGLSDLLKVFQQSGSPTVYQGLCDSGLTRPRPQDVDLKSSCSDVS